MTKATEMWINHLRDALTEVEQISITERQRATFRKACASALVEAEDALLHEYATRNSGRPWNEEDVALLSSSLDESELCGSYTQEVMTLEMLSQRLGRPVKTIKKKAIELGFGKKVDWWVNRANDQ